MHPLRILSALCLTALLAPAAAAQDQHEHGGAPPETLGAVHFETSCDPAVRDGFDRAVALLHSFWFRASLAAFQKVAEADPSCGMAHWGAALSYWGNPFVTIRSPRSLQSGRAAIEQAQSAGAKTDRERAYIGAVAELYKDYETRDNRTRALAYEAAMEQVASRFPDDKEAAAFYALAVNQTALPTDKTYANQLKAAKILEALFVEQPNHPGLAHYIIHTYDTPALADRGLDAARRYAKIAPSAPHALHMPSHTFTRVGHWNDSIETNIASAAAAAREGSYAESLHAMDYQVYAYLQVGQERAAKGIVDRLPEITQRFDPNAMGDAAPGLAGEFALAAIPARYALERAAWAEAAQLAVRGTPFAFVDAITHFARALGAARSGNAAAARADSAKLAELSARLATAREAYWAEQVDIQRRVADAWIAWAEGRKDEALAALRAAADAEDATDKSAVTPGPLKPARELLGEMLLDAGQPAAALAEFDKTTKKEPNRFWAVYGAGRSAALAGERDRAAAYYRQLLEICEGADRPGRAALAEAERFLGRS